MKIILAITALALAVPAGAQMFGQTAVAETVLQKVAGRADLAQEIRAANSAMVTGNRINGDSVTGAVSFDGQAFQNLNGLAVISANSGNNVAINASLNVNVSINP